MKVSKKDMALFIQSYADIIFNIHILPVKEAVLTSICKQRIFDVMSPVFAVAHTCGVLTCDLSCPHGFARGADGCQECKCLDPCEVGSKMFLPALLSSVTFLASGLVKADIYYYSRKGL